MPIVKPTEMNFSNKNIIMIISGLPGTGKTTLALSAPDVLLIDTDEGMARVNPAHRKDASICKTYEEVLSDIKAAEGKYKTIVIDTCGALIEYMKDWAMRTDPKASKKDGGFSLQGYGIIKSEFVRLSAELRKKFNVIFLFHESMTKVDENVFYELVVEGSARTLVYQPADLAAHLFIQTGKRYLGFTPTEQYSAKAAYGIKGLIEVPELKEGEPNDFLTKLFEKVRSNLAAESAALGSEQQKYDYAISDAKKIVATVNAPEDVQAAATAISKLDHGLTSEKEAKSMLKKRMDELGIIYDKATKSYAYKAS
jgi:hypothetical protein